jgi:hypothetical protein
MAPDMKPQMAQMNAAADYTDYADKIFILAIREMLTRL